MPTIPINRVVSVTLSRNTRFPTRRGFGTPLILTNETVTDVLDASNLTKLYTSWADVANDWDATDATYKAAQAMFAQNPSPTQIRIGYVPLTGASTTSDFEDAMDAIAAVASDFFWVVLAYPLRDIDAVAGLTAWIEASNYLALIDTHDALTKDETDDTCLAAVLKGTVEQSAAMYNGAVGDNKGVALAAVLSTYDFDQPNTAYTAKFQNLRGQTADDLTGAEAQAITGFVPGVGQNSTSGHLANCYIAIGDQNMVAEGSMLSQNVFMDELHTEKWLIARTGEALLGVLLNNDRVPMTDEGMEVLSAAVRGVMDTAVRAGLIADIEDPDTGDLLPAYEITYPDVMDLPEVQRKNRIAPTITCAFIYAGAVHYTSAQFDMSF